MPGSWPDECQPRDRTAAIRQIVTDLLQSRRAGEPPADEALLAQHPELLPELAEELRKLRCVCSALEQAEDPLRPGGVPLLGTPSSEVEGDDEQLERALQRLEDDWRQDQAGDQDADRIPATAATRPDGPPEYIGRYRVLGLLGEGGFGRVYAARDDDLSRDVAIKVLERHAATETRRRAEELEEARNVARLDHPAIVPVYDAGQMEDGRGYVVSKRIHGQDLAARIQASRLPPTQAVRVVIDVAEALHYAHCQGLVHRDIKPANILLDVEQRPYLTDFGLALRDDAVRDRRCHVGTPAYIVPEQAGGEAHRVDGRSDVFSLGVVLYELLTGSKPFSADSYEGLLERIIWSEPAPPRQHDGTLPLELERICLKALAKRAADRYPAANELAADLRDWLAAGTQAERSSVDAPAGDAARRSAIRVIPKGLRAFDATDADFFLELVPGPRDRNGLPESIRQWKYRLESNDAGETFSIGVLYGPTGCGKSSWVRAGLLPRLASHVACIYSEATADDTEEKLRQRLQARYPALPAEADLVDCLATIRRGRGATAGQKVLVVLDQFEQWLHGRGEPDRRLLVQALRQCDGQRLQCLLLVRDDFWVALSRFLAEVEVELIQGHNTALVDLFEPAHARRVLAEFGRAYGQLPDDLREITNSQQQFLSRAVEGLAQEERIVPVRLALFADMVRSRPWTPTTLRAVGGAAGVGVAFLEETFGARCSHPQYRVHAAAARAVLQALLPEPGSDIKGRLRSQLELLDLSGYGNKPRAFRELLRLLDQETRLLTPTEPAPSSVESVAARYYQLTHDYLVPSLREWLTTKQKSTPRGRAALRLAERSQMWNARPEGRQLPSLGEWLTIRMLTRRDQWTPLQTSMMRVATRRHARTLAAAVLFLIAGLLGGAQFASSARDVWNRFRATGAAFALGLGRQEAVWPLLKHGPDPTVRTRLIHGSSPLAISPDSVLGQLNTQEDPSVRRAMLLVAGERVGDREQRTSRWSALRENDPLMQQLLRLYQEDPDPGLHGAAEWTLRRYDQDAAVERTDQQLRTAAIPTDHHWFINSHGHTLVLLPGPSQFLMGSPSEAATRANDETLHRQWIHRSFCLATKETTARQFQQFLREQTPAEPLPAAFAGGGSDLPQAGVSWYQAAAYCNWLSQKEGLPADQWCYQPNADGRYAAGMRVTANHHTLSGYRLPSEAEWEYACRAGSVTARPFGEGDAYLDRYAVCLPGSDGEPLPVGHRKPNDFGLFDLLGNVAEWCQDRYQHDLVGGSSGVAGAAESVVGSEARVVRGGSYRDEPAQVRSAARSQQWPDLRSASIGFRIARSLP